MQAFVITNNVGMMINVGVNAKNPLIKVSGNNLESQGSIQKNKKMVLRNVKGYFVW